MSLDDSSLFEKLRQAADEDGMPTEAETESAMDAALLSALVQNARNPDPAAAADAFTGLARQFWRLLLTVCGKYFRQDAEDLAQDVLLKIWITRERLAPAQDFRRYLSKVARNHCLDRLRKEASMGSLAPQQIADTDSASQAAILADPAPVKEQERIQLRDDLRTALMPLTPLQRFILQQVNDGYRITEIATQLKCTAPNVQYHRDVAFKHIRAVLRREDPKPSATT